MVERRNKHRGILAAPNTVERLNKYGPGTVPPGPGPSSGARSGIGTTRTGLKRGALSPRLLGEYSAPRSSAQVDCAPARTVEMPPSPSQRGMILPTSTALKRPMPAMTQQWLSQKLIPARERLIFALDTTDIEEAKRLVTELGDNVDFYKLGLELFVAGGYFQLLEWLAERKKKSFVDLKFFDVPQTVASAVRQLRGKNAHFVTVHGNDEIVRAACSEKNGVKILAVTVLTSLNQTDIEEFGYTGLSVRDLVLSRAKRALAVGADGVISSGLEAPDLREQLGERFLIVVPGIRPVENIIVDDQKRTVDVEEAFQNGADYIVVGRPIKNAPDRAKAASDIQERISRLFGEDS
jgi:orotidine-5'-phosphate decarboxylase